MGKHLADRQDGQGPREVGAAWSWPPGERGKKGKRDYHLDKLFLGTPLRIFEAALSFHFSKREAKVLSAVCRRTYGWGKKKAALRKKSCLRVDAL